ncbi:Transient receptor potential-gamma protein [Nymphon striatum]|nr:Transient receptor potential-gamma protein [Nymphon striatum]
MDAARDVMDAVRDVIPVACEALLSKMLLLLWLRSIPCFNATATTREALSWEAIDRDAASFTPDITPLILAAHRDNYEIVKILLDRGASLPVPHDVRCGCDECVVQSSEDSLRHSRSRINAYRALASPSLIALSSKDPIMTAFELSWELRRLSFMEHEFKLEYQELRQQCQDFGTALLDHTRSSYELEVLLNHDPSPNGLDYQHGARMHLNRLKLAIKYKQKKGFIGKIEVQWLDTIIDITCLLILASQRIKTNFTDLLSIEDETSNEVTTKRGAQPTLVEWMILAWVMGLIWNEIKQLWEDGLMEYISDMWNIIDFVTNSLYVATIGLRIVAYFQKVPENGDVSRKTARCSAQQVAAILDSDDEETLGFDEDYPSDELETDSDDNVDNDNDSESDSDNENPVDRLPVRPVIGHNFDSGWNKKYFGVNKHLDNITGKYQLPSPNR